MITKHAAAGQPSWTHVERHVVSEDLKAARPTHPGLRTDHPSFAGDYSSSSELSQVLRGKGRSQLPDPSPGCVIARSPGRAGALAPSH